MELDPGLQLELVGRLVVAVALAGLIGLERELQREQAGLRTHTLVGLGAATFTVISAHAFSGASPDPTRIAAQIVTGVGFIGAGTILRLEGGVRGLSTAASLWAAGAIGMAAGAGLFVIAAGSTVLALVVLELLDRLEIAYLRDRFHVTSTDEAGPARDRPPGAPD